MIREVKAAEIFSAPGLVSEYAAECSVSLIGEINPQLAMYEAMEAAGVLKCFGAFDGNALVGFATVLTTVYPHYGVKVATIESLFARKFGLDLMQAVERYAKEAGCKTIMYSAPTGGRLERLLSAKKLERTNTIFCKPL